MGTNLQLLSVYWLWIQSWMEAYQVLWEQILRTVEEVTTGKPIDQESFRVSPQ